MKAIQLDPFSPELARIDRAIEVEERLIADPAGNDWSRATAKRNLHELIGKRAGLMRQLRGEDDYAPPVAPEGSSLRESLNMLALVVGLTIALALVGFVEVRGWWL